MSIYKLNKPKLKKPNKLNKLNKLECILIAIGIIFLLLMAFQKIIQGSFNQSHSFFGESAGKQCACCSLYAICFSTVVKSSGNWNKTDIDFVVTEGDRVYKSLNKNSYLMVTDLPNIFPIFESDVKITFLENKYGVLKNIFIPRFLSTSNNSKADGLLFFIKSICVAIIPKKNSVYLFDSHSRNSFGKPTPDGFASVMKFKNKKDLEMYLHSTYVDQTQQNIKEQFEIQYISIEINKGIDLSARYSIETNRKRSANETNKEKCRKRNATETSKAKCRKRNATETSKEKCRKRDAIETSKEKVLKQLLIAF